MNNVATTSREYQLRWWTLGVMAISILIIVIDSSIVNIALPTLQRELNTSMSELQWIINAYIMAFAAPMLMMGALGDRWGRAYMLQAGIAVFGCASLAAVFVSTGVQLIICRTIMGIGGAMILPTTLAIVTNIFPREERGRAIGVWAGMNAIGVALGPIIGGLIIDNLNWNWIFIINIPIAVVAIVAGRFLVPNSRDPSPQRPDYPGTVLSISGLSLLVFGLIQGGDWGWKDPAVIGSLAGSAVLIALFIIWERYTTHPMLEIGFFRSSRFSAGIGAVGITGLSMMGIVFGLTLYMQFVNGYNALQTGIRFVPLALGMFIGAGSADRVVSRLGTTLVVVLGFIGSAVLMVLASFWQVDTDYWILGSILFGVGFFLGYIAAPATDAVMGALPEARAGVGSGITAVSRLVAASIGVASLGSALSSIYSSSFEKAASAIAGLPTEVMQAASDSVGAAVIVAQKLPPGVGDAVASIARESFMDGWQMMAFVAGGISLIGVVITLKFMPPRHQPLPKNGAGLR